MQNTRPHQTEQADQLLTQAQAAQWLGMSSAWFEQNRFRGTGLPYIKIGRSVRYSRLAIQEWLLAQTVGAGI